MKSEVILISIVALPAGIITAGYMTEVQKFDETEAKQKQGDE